MIEQTTTAPQSNKHDLLRDKYNQAPYRSFPFFQTHPNHLFTLAKLFGLQPKPMEDARILELGCAAGGNLIPMAYHYPTAEFLGIDLAEKQIEQGLEQIQDLGIKNLRLRAQSISDFNPTEGQFDYIICHGVYSWVDTPVRDKILSICRQNLSKNGVAYVSYNTLPGWNMVNSVRDLMRWHTHNITDLDQKAQQARIVLKFISDGLQEDPSPYASFLRSEIQLLSKYADDYLLHEHLSTYNNPLYFHQFMEQALPHKLSYLADALLETMYSDNLPPVFANELKKVTNIIATQQYMDFIRNQRFRCTLLCHQEQTINRSLKTTDIAQFYLQLVGKPENAALSEKDLQDGKEICFTHSNITYRIRNAISQLAMLILHEERLKPIHYDELCKKMLKRSSIKDLKQIKYHLDEDLNLMRAVLAGLINISSQPENYVTAPSHKPIVCPLARYQAGKQAFVTNRRHQAIQLGPLSLIIVPKLDGTQNQEDIYQLALKAVKEGKISLIDQNKQPIHDEKILSSQLQEAIQNELKFLASNALLVKA